MFPPKYALEISSDGWVASTSSKMHSNTTKRTLLPRKHTSITLTYTSLRNVTWTKQLIYSLLCFDFEITTRSFHRVSIEVRQIRIHTTILVESAKLRQPMKTQREVVRSVHDCHHRSNKINSTTISCGRLHKISKKILFKAYETISTTSL